MRRTRQLDLAAPMRRPPQDGPVEVLVPVRTVGPNAREHWSGRARRVRAERQATAWALVRHAPVRLPVIVTLTRLSPGELDDDNLQGACKGVRDEVARWLGCDDAPGAPAVWRYAQAKVRRRTKAQPAEAIGVHVRVERDVVAAEGSRDIS